MGIILGFIFSPLGRYVAVGLAIMAVIGGIYWKGRNDGKGHAIEGINRQTERAIEDAHIAARTVDECYRLDGMRWNIARAKCERDTGNTR